MDLQTNTTQGGTGNTQHNTYNFSNSKPNQPIPSNVRAGSQQFVGRETELEAIHIKLQNASRVAVCAVSGMGGIGKTELALQYAAKYQNEYAARYWLTIRDRGLAQAVIETAAPYLQLPEALRPAGAEQQAEWYWQNWLPKEGKLLAILDDVPSAEAIPEAAMPLDARIQILVTTQMTVLDPSFAVVPLDLLSEDQALALLGKLVGPQRVETERQQAAQVCQAVEYLPLAVELVGEYLVKNRRKKFGDVLPQLPPVLDVDRTRRGYGQRGVNGAIRLAWDDLSDSTKRVGMFLGLFDPTAIEWDFFAAVAGVAGLSEAELDAACSELDQTHLMQPMDAEGTTYRVHRLVRAFLQVRLKEEAEMDRAYRGVFVETLLSIAKQVPQIPHREQIAAVAPAIPHLEALSRELLEDIPNPEEDLVWAFLGVARFYQGQGLYAPAEDQLQRCVQATETRLGEKHPSIATSLNNLAVLYKLMGRYAEAESLLVRSLSIWEEQLGDKHSNVATSLNNLGSLYELMGRYAEAEPLLVRSLSISEEKLGDKHPNIASSLNNLAVLYKSMGRYAEAEPLYVRSLSICEGQSEVNYSDVATGLNNLAGLYELMGRYAEAESLYVRALSIDKQVYGENHPETATTLNNLGLLYKSMGRYEEALLRYVQSLTIREEKLEAKHPDIAQSLNNLASLYYTMRRYEQALPLCERSLSIREEKLGEKDTDVAQSLNTLALLYRAIGRYAEALTLRLRCLEIEKKALGENHPQFAASLNNLGLLYQAMGRNEEALGPYERSLSIREEQLGTNHPDVAQSLNNLGVLYKSMGRYEAALPLYGRAVAIAEGVLGADHPNTVTIRGNYDQLRAAMEANP